MTKNYFDNIDVLIRGQIAEKKRIEKFAQSTIHYFMPRLRRNVLIEIKFTPNSDGIAYGYCSGDKDIVTIEISKKDPLKPLKKLKMKQMMQTLAHELIHAKQFIKGELTPTMQNFRGKNHIKTPYSRQPWEHEAYKKEEFIYHLFWEK
jgi:hypothetical protein|tara:strand:+ start:456 stop:899 length:444 start_codon:yes stop_codon:yes gene_type:complete